MQSLGLIAIYLCNSYIKGKMVELVISDHTNLSGKNGAGKTSALQLLPCFYGHSPEKLVSKAGGKSSFLDYYLPSLGSMIVFHYRRADGDRTAVMLRHPSQKIVYRFISASPHSTLFAETWIEKIKAGRYAVDLLNELKGSSHDFTVSRQIENISDYRSIIQNDKKLRSSRNKSPLRSLAWEFSLGGSDPTSTCTDMDYLTFAILKRSDMIEQLKLMIVHTQFSSVVPERPHHEDDNKLVADIRAIRDFEERRVEEIRKTVDLYHMLEIDRQKIQGYRSFLVEEQPGLEREKQQLADALTVKESEHNEFKRDTDQRLGDLGHEETITERLVTRLGEDIDALVEQRDYWTGQNIDHKVEQAEHLDMAEAEVVEARDFLNSLSEQQESIEVWRDDQIARLNTKKESLLKGITDQVSQLESRKGELEWSKKLKLEQIEKRLGEDVSALKEAFGNESQKLSNEQTRLQTLLQKAAPEPEDRQREERAESDFSDRSFEYDRAFKAHTKLENEYAHCEKAVNTLQTEWEAANDLFKQQEKNLDALNRLLFPDKNSLLSCLRENKPDWGRDIGRVIQPELLTRTDLQPELADDEIPQFYGLSLELERLDPVDAARDEVQIRSDIDDAKLLLQEYEKQRDKIEKSIREGRSDLKKVNQHLLKASAELNQARDRQNSARDTVNSARVETKRAIERRQNEYRDALHEVQAKTESSHQQFERQCETKKQLAQDEKDEFISFNACELSHLDERIAVQEDEKKRAESEHKEALKHVKMAYQQKCQDQGVDDNTLRSARSALDEREKKVAEIHSFQQLVQQYREWFRNDWSQYEIWSEDLTAKKRQLSETREEIRRLTQSRLARQQQFDSFKTRQLEQQKEIVRQLRIITDILEQVVVSTADNAHRPEGLRRDNIEQVVNDLETLHTRYKKGRRRLINETRDIHSMILNRQGSQLTDYWVNRSQDLLNKLRLVSADISEDSEQYLQELTPNLEELIDTQVPTIRESLIQTANITMTRVMDYIEGLERIETETRRITRYLHDRLNIGQRIPSLSNIKILLSSKIHDLDGWHEFDRFRTVYNAHKKIGDRSLPPVELEKALDDILLITRVAGKKQELKHLISMAIAMEENGRAIEIRSDRDLNNASSNGLSYLAVIVIFRALARHLCPDENIRLTWPVDEIGTLDANNLSLLFAMLTEANITMVGAVPTTDPVTLRHFKFKWVIDRDNGVKQFATSLGRIDAATDQLRDAFGGKEAVNDGSDPAIAGGSSEPVF